MDKERNYRKVRQGVVTSAAMDKSVTVKLERRIQHTLYKKIIKKSTKVMAHDENNEAKVGDKVSVMETRPLSKNKRWRVLRIERKADRDTAGK